jgi:hypothetical protein
VLAPRTSGTNVLAPREWDNVLAPQNEWALHLATVGTRTYNEWAPHLSNSGHSPSRVGYSHLSNEWATLTSATSGLLSPQQRVGYSHLSNEWATLTSGWEWESFSFSLGCQGGNGNHSHSRQAPQLILNRLSQLILKSDALLRKRPILRALYIPHFR